MGYVYKKRTSAMIDAKIHELKTGGGYQPFKSEYVVWKPKDGDNIIRILPPTWEDPDHYGIIANIHFFIGPEKSSFICPHKERIGPCPLCDRRAELEARGRKEEAKKYKATARTIVWIIDRKEENKGPQLWGMPLSKVDSVILESSKNKRTGDTYPVDDPEEGFDIFIKKSGQGLNTEYVVTLDRESTPIKKEWLDFVIKHPIPSTFVHVDAESIKVEMDGIAPEELEDIAPPPPSRHRLIDEEENADSDIPFEHAKEEKTEKKEERRERKESPKSSRNRLELLKSLPMRKVFRLAETYDLDIPADLPDDKMPEFLDANLPDDAEIG